MPKIDIGSAPTRMGSTYPPPLNEPWQGSSPMEGGCRHWSHAVRRETVDRRSIYGTTQL